MTLKEILEEAVSTEQDRFLLVESLSKQRSLRVKLYNIRNHLPLGRELKISPFTDLDERGKKRFFLKISKKGEEFRVFGENLIEVVQTQGGER